METNTDLGGVAGWPQAVRERLAASWITSAEQVVAIAATVGGVRSLAVQAQVSEAQMHDLVRTATDHLPAEVAQRLSRPADTTQFGLGARPPTLDIHAEDDAV